MELAERSFAENFKQSTLPDLRRYTAECGFKLRLAESRLSINELCRPIINFLQELLSTFDSDVLNDFQRASIWLHLGQGLL